MRNKVEALRAKLLSFNSLCMCDSQSLGLKLKERRVEWQ
jgi:hypothetical protein